MIHLAIVEDNDATAQLLRSYLEKFSSSLDSLERSTPPQFAIQRFTTADAFLQAYAQNFQLVFLDIQMPGTDGMHAAQILRARDSSVSIVFITSLAQFAMRGYCVNALDYIVKPLDYPRFATKMRRILRMIPAMRNPEQPSLLVSSEGKRYVFSAPDVYYARVEDHHVTLITSSGSIPVPSSLRALQSDLERLGLVRISSSTMVNYRFVTGMDRTSVVVRCPVQTQVSQDSRDSRNSPDSQGSAPQTSLADVTLPLSRARSAAARARLTQRLASGGITGGTV